MLRKTLLWGALLIGAYIAVKNYKGFAADLNASSTGATNVVKTLQGR